MLKGDSIFGEGNSITSKIISAADKAIQQKCEHLEESVQEELIQKILETYSHRLSFDFLLEITRQTTTDLIEIYKNDQGVLGFNFDSDSFDSYRVHFRKSLVILINYHLDSGRSILPHDYSTFADYKAQIDKVISLEEKRRDKDIHALNKELMLWAGVILGANTHKRHVPAVSYAHPHMISEEFIAEVGKIDALFATEGVPIQALIENVNQLLKGKHSEQWRVILSLEEDNATTKCAPENVAVLSNKLAALHKQHRLIALEEGDRESLREDIRDKDTLFFPSCIPVCFFDSGDVARHELRHAILDKCLHVMQLNSQCKLARTETEPEDCYELDLEYALAYSELAKQAKKYMPLDSSKPLSGMAYAVPTIEQCVTILVDAEVSNERYPGCTGEAKPWEGTLKDTWCSSYAAFSECDPSEVEDHLRMIVCYLKGEAYVTEHAKLRLQYRLREVVGQQLREAIDKHVSHGPSYAIQKRGRLLTIDYNAYEATSISPTIAIPPMNELNLLRSLNCVAYGDWSRREEYENALSEADVKSDSFGIKLLALLQSAKADDVYDIPLSILETSESPQWSPALVDGLEKEITSAAWSFPADNKLPEIFCKAWAPRAAFWQASRMNELPSDYLVRVVSYICHSIFSNRFLSIDSLSKYVDSKLSIHQVALCLQHYWNSSSSIAITKRGLSSFESPSAIPHSSSYSVNHTGAAGIKAFKQLPQFKIGIKWALHHCHRKQYQPMLLFSYFIQDEPTQEVSKWLNEYGEQALLMDPKLGFNLFRARAAYDLTKGYEYPMWLSSVVRRYGLRLVLSYMSRYTQYTVELNQLYLMLKVLKDEASGLLFEHWITANQNLHRLVTGLNSSCGDASCNSAMCVRNWYSYIGKRVIVLHKIKKLISPQIYESAGLLEERQAAQSMTAEDGYQFRRSYISVAAMKVAGFDGFSEFFNELRGSLVQESWENGSDMSLLVSRYKLLLKLDREKMQGDFYGLIHPDLSCKLLTSGFEPEDNIESSVDAVPVDPRASTVPAAIASSVGAMPLDRRESAVPVCVWPSANRHSTRVLRDLVQGLFGAVSPLVEADYFEGLRYSDDGSATLVCLIRWLQAGDSSLVEHHKQWMRYRNQIAEQIALSAEPALYAVLGEMGILFQREDWEIIAMTSPMGTGGILILLDTIFHFTFEMLVQCFGVLVQQLHLMSFHDYGKGLLSFISRAQHMFLVDNSHRVRFLTGNCSCLPRDKQRICHLDREYHLIAMCEEPPASDWLTGIEFCKPRFIYACYHYDADVSHRHSSTSECLFGLLRLSFESAVYQELEEPLKRVIPRLNKRDGLRFLRMLFSYHSELFEMESLRPLLLEAFRKVDKDQLDMSPAAIDCVSAYMGEVVDSHFVNKLRDTSFVNRILSGGEYHLLYILPDILEDNVSCLREFLVKCMCKLTKRDKSDLFYFEYREQCRKFIDSYFEKQYYFTPTDEFLAALMQLDMSQRAEILEGRAQYSHVYDIVLDVMVPDDMKSKIQACKQKALLTYSDDMQIFYHYTVLRSLSHLLQPGIKGFLHQVRVFSVMLKCPEFAKFIVEKYVSSPSKDLVFIMLFWSNIGTFFQEYDFEVINRCFKSASTREQLSLLYVLQNTVTPSYGMQTRTLYDQPGRVKAILAYLGCQRVDDNIFKVLLLLGEWSLSWKDAFSEIRSCGKFMLREGFNLRITDGHLETYREKLIYSLMLPAEWYNQSCEYGSLDKKRLLKLIELSSDTALQGLYDHFVCKPTEGLPTFNQLSEWLIQQEINQLGAQRKRILRRKICHYAECLRGLFHDVDSNPGIVSLYEAHTLLVLSMSIPESVRDSESMVAISVEALQQCLLLPTDMSIETLGRSDRFRSNFGDMISRYIKHILNRLSTKQWPQLIDTVLADKCALSDKSAIIEQIIEKLSGQKWCHLDGQQMLQLWKRHYASLKLQPRFLGVMLDKLDAKLRPQLLDTVLADTCALSDRPTIIDSLVIDWFVERCREHNWCHLTMDRMLLILNTFGLQLPQLNLLIAAMLEQCENITDNARQAEVRLEVFKFVQMHFTKTRRELRLDLLKKVVALGDKRTINRLINWLIKDVFNVASYNIPHFVQHELKVLLAFDDSPCPDEMLQWLIAHIAAREFLLPYRTLKSIFGIKSYQVSLFLELVCVHITASYDGDNVYKYSSFLKGCLEFIPPCESSAQLMRRLMLTSERCMVSCPQYFQHLLYPVTCGRHEVLPVVYRKFLHSGFAKPRDCYQLIAVMSEFEQQGILKNVFLNDSIRTFVSKIICSILLGSVSEFNRSEIENLVKMVQRAEFEFDCDVLSVLWHHGRKRIVVKLLECGRYKELRSALSNKIKGASSSGSGHDLIRRDIARVNEVSFSIDHQKLLQAIFEYALSCASPGDFPEWLVDASAGCDFIVEASMLENFLQVYKRRNPNICLWQSDLHLSQYLLNRLLTDGVNLSDFPCLQCFVDASKEHIDAEQMLRISNIFGRQKAATKIQALYRGHQGRKAVERQVLNNPKSVPVNTFKSLISKMGKKDLEGLFNRDMDIPAWCKQSLEHTRALLQYIHQKIDFLGPSSINEFCECAVAELVEKRHSGVEESSPELDMAADEATTAGSGSVPVQKPLYCNQYEFMATTRHDLRVELERASKFELSLRRNMLLAQYIASRQRDDRSYFFISWFGHSRDEKLSAAHSLLSGKQPTGRLAAAAQQGLLGRINRLTKPLASAIH